MRKWNVVEFTIAMEGLSYALNGDITVVLRRNFVGATKSGGGMLSP
jgi:hypothetical protein